MNAVIHVKVRVVLRRSYSASRTVRYNEAACRFLASFHKRSITTLPENGDCLTMTNNNDPQWIAPQPLKSFPKRICFGSCSSQYDGDLIYWDRIVAAKPDLVLLLGDNVYAPPKLHSREEDLDSSEVYQSQNGDTESSDKVGGSIMHASYQALMANASFRRAAGQIPILATLDDNDYNVRNLDATEMTEDEMHNELEVAKQAFLQFFQIPMSDTRWNVGRGVYTSYDFYLQKDGTTTAWCSTSHEPNRVSKEDILWRLQIILLDVRRHKTSFAKRALQTNDDTEDICVGPYMPDDGVHTTMLGAAQWQWLEEQLTRDRAPNLRLLVSPIQVLSDGQHGWDCWSLFPRERQRLLSLLRSETNTTTPTLVLSGDRHVAGFYTQSFGPGNDLVEVMSSSLTHSVPQGVLDHENDASRVGDFIHANNFGMLELEENVIGSGAPNYRLSNHCAKTGKLIRQYV
jgi:alkaline phosphatase D